MKRIEETIEFDQFGNVINNKFIASEIDYHTSKEPPFVKVYLDSILFMNDLPKNLNPVLQILLTKMPVGGGAIAISSAVKRDIAKQLGCSFSKINNAVSQLYQGGLLLRKDVGYYQFNPMFFGRGEWKDIKALRLTTTFDMRGTSFMAQVAKHKEQQQLAGQQEMFGMNKDEYGEPVDIYADSDWES